MPGIFGCIDRSGNRVPEKMAIEMANSLKHEDSYVGEWILDSCLLGTVELEFLHNNLNLVTTEEKSLIGVSRGNVYNKRELSEKLGIGCISSSPNDTQFLLELYKKKGLDFAKYLNGLFSVGIYDRGKDRVVVANDRYAHYPMFYSLNSKRFVFASEAKAILKDPLVIPRMNKIAIPEFFSFSCLLGDKSFFKNVKMMMPATTLVYDGAADRVRIRQYWDFAIPREKATSVDDLLKEFKKLMKRAVELMVQDRKEVGVFLSGGLDSRIVTAFASRTDANVITFTFGVKNCLAQKIGKEVADRLGIENVFYEIPPDFVANHAEKIVYKGDGLVRIRESHYIALLDKVRRRVSTVLIGTFGESLFGYNIKKELLGLERRARAAKIEEVTDYIFGNCLRGLPLSEYHDAFCDDFGKKAMSKLKNSFRKTLNSIVMNKNIDSVQDMVDYWDYKVREAGVRGLSVQYMNWYLETRHPFLDNELVDFFAFRLPARLRLGEKFLQMAVNYCFPSLCDIPLERHGVPPDSPPLKVFVGRIKLFAKRRTRIAMERLSRGRLILKPVDYRDYGNWLRTGSKAYVEEILLNPKTLERGYFRQNYIKRIVEEHMMAKRNHDQLICDLINFELMNRIFFDVAP